MKQHRLWAWAMIVCLVMLFYTGKKTQIKSHKTEMEDIYG